MATHTQRSTFTQKMLGYSGLVVILLIVLIPYGYVALTAFKPADEIFDVRWFPKVWSLDAWRYAIEFEQFHVYIYNSMIAGLGAALLALCVAVPGAYVFRAQAVPRQGRDVLHHRHGAAVSLRAARRTLHHPVGEDRAVRHHAGAVAGVPGVHHPLRHLDSARLFRRAAAVPRRMRHGVRLHGVQGVLARQCCHWPSRSSPR